MNSNVMQFSNGKLLHVDLFRYCDPSFALTKVRNVEIDPASGGAIHTEYVLKSQWTLVYVGAGDEETSQVISTVEVPLGGISESIPDHIRGLIGKNTKVKFTEEHAAWAQGRVDKIVALHQAIVDASGVETLPDDAPAAPGAGSLTDKLTTIINGFVAQLGPDGNNGKPGYHILGSTTSEWADSLDMVAESLAIQGIELNEHQCEKLLASPLLSSSSHLNEPANEA